MIVISALVLSITINVMTKIAIIIVNVNDIIIEERIKESATESQLIKTNLRWRGRIGELASPASGLKFGMT